MQKKVTIYTDGACSGNPGPGGWGAILMYQDHKKELSGYEPDTTNNRMELRAVIEALNALNELTRNGYGCTIRARGDLTKFTLEGSGMALQHGVASQLFSSLRKANIHVWLITTSETRIEFCVDAVDALKAVDEVKTKFGIG